MDGASAGLIDEPPPSVRDQRELIVELIVEGFSAEEAFARAVGGDA
jgi:hypothetical protein